MGSRYPVSKDGAGTRIDPGEISRHRPVATSRRVARSFAAKAELECRRLQLAIDAVPEALAVFDAAGQVLDLNAAFAKLHGFAAPSDVRIDLRLLFERFTLNSSGGRTLPVYDWPVMRALRGEAVFDLEIQARRIDTGEIAYLGCVNATPNFDERGEVVLAVLTIRDIAQSRAQELREANGELHEFVNTVAHDLRAPLRGILGFTTALLEDERERMSAVGIRHTERIADAARKMERFIHDLLAYSRLSYSDVPSHRVSINDVCVLALQALEEQIRSSDAQIYIQPGMPDVLASRAMLEQVLLQLFDNALKFVAFGVPPEIAVRAESRGATVRVIVTDNGIGIDPTQHERIFRPFERLHGEETYPGTGIGLAIVRRALSRMHGRAGIDSIDGGSRFWFELRAASMLRESTVGQNNRTRR